MAAQCFEEGLEAAADQAAQDRAVRLHLTDPRRAGDLPGRGGAGEADLYAPYRHFLGPLFTEALRIARQIDDRVAQFYLLAALGCRAAQAGQARLAARLIAAAHTERTGAGANVMPFLAPVLTVATESAAAALGPARYEAESEAGRHLGRDAALDLALGQPAAKAGDGQPAAKAGDGQPAAKAGAGQPAAKAGDGQATGGPGPVTPGPLGPREADVARLVAEGLTNKQIGVRLFISERTVDSHVRSILNKLGFSSRAQIAAWMAADG